MRAGEPVQTGPQPAGDDAIFQQIVVGIDETPESVVGAVQAGVLRAPDGHLVLVAVAERYHAAHAGAAALHAADRLSADTETDLARAKELVDADATVLSSGRLVDVLCAESAGRGAQLIAVGVRPHSRVGALTFGGHDVDALHDVRCSLLISRPGWGPAKPERIVVAADGSPESRAAESVARALGARLGCEVLAVVGLGDDVDLDLLRSERTDALLDPRPLLEAVVAASSPRSLVVVGRGEGRGRRSRRKFAERVVSGARCSVLVVQHATAAA